MKHDKPLFALLIGMIVVIPIEIMALIFKRLGWITITNGEACSMIFMPQGSWYLGLLALPSVGALAIIIFYLLTKLIGTDYLAIKGIYIGMLAHSFVFAIFGVLADNPNMLQDTLGNYIFAATSGFGGSFAGYLLQKYVFVPNESTQRPRVHRYSLFPKPALKKEESGQRIIKLKKL